MTDNKGNSCWLKTQYNIRIIPFEVNLSTLLYLIIVSVSIVSNFAHKGKMVLLLPIPSKNVSDSEQTVLFDFVAKTDLLPVWSSGTIGLKDANDVVNWDAQDAIFKAKDLGNN